MATKPAAKKSTKKRVAKRPVVKAVRAPKATKRSVKVTTKHVAPLRSFRKAEPTGSFMDFKITTQTIYWLIIGFIVLSLGAWVMVISVRVQNIYDQIDMNNAVLYADPVTK